MCIYWLSICNNIDIRLALLLWVNTRLKFSRSTFPAYWAELYHYCALYRHERVPARAHTHTHTRTHARTERERVNGTAWRGDISNTVWKCEFVWWPNFARETVPDRRCSMRKISDQASACTEREDRKWKDQRKSVVRKLWRVQLSRQGCESLSPEPPLFLNKDYGQSGQWETFKVPATLKLLLNREPSC